MPRPGDKDTERYREGQRKKKEYKAQLPGPDDEPLPPATEPIQSEGKPKRNAPCPCGSGKKYKQCCAVKDS